MSVIFSSVDALVGDLRRRLGGASIVGIDGWTGVGKTTLAQRLASELHGAAYDLDSALTHDLKVYISAIRLEEIAQAVADAPGILFVSGVCLREILKRAEIQADAHIYVKRMASWGWSDEDEMAGQGVAEIPGASGEFLRAEMRQYHGQWRPHQIADYEFHRFD